MLIEIQHHSALPGLGNDDHGQYYADTTIGSRAKNYTTTGLITAGSLQVDNVNINGSAIAVIGVTRGGFVINGFDGEFDISGDFSDGNRAILITTNAKGVVPAQVVLDSRPRGGWQFNNYASGNGSGLPAFMIQDFGKHEADAINPNGILVLTTESITDGDTNLIWKNDAKNYSVGIDATDADKFIISDGLILGTGNILEMSTTLVAAAGNLQGLRLISKNDGDQMDMYMSVNQAYINWNDGFLHLSTDEGTNTNSEVWVLGKGTGYGIIKVYDQDDAEFIFMACSDGIGEITMSGTLPGLLKINKTGDSDVTFFQNVAEGETPLIQIYGYGTGGSKINFDIACAIEENTTVTMNGNAANLDIQLDTQIDGDFNVTGSTDCGDSCEADAYTVGGVAGIDFSGAVSTITVVKGIVTAAAA